MFQHIYVLKLFLNNGNFYRMAQEDLNKLLIQIGVRVKSLRKKENISQLDLGNIVGRSANQIGRIERAEGNPTIKTLHRIATHYGVDISYFLGEPHKK